ncbi:MAPEG family protein [Aliiglaciecola litoralis]|uniref:MAPEG family protein n=1 Tax=Aliiglaciecola litoralis TaxID=582857 RepID=A0ABP3WQ48_9ALTE
MTIIICLIIATAMPILFKAPLAVAMNKLGGYDNRHPRAQQSKLTGFGARAKAVHENSFEALIMFTPGAVTAIATGTTGYLADTLAITFVVARMMYALCYWFDIHVLRSAVWFVGFGCSIGLLLLSL